MMMNKIFKLFVFSLYMTVSFAQESTMGAQDRKYCKTYFLAEKYKFLEDYELSAEKYKECININPDEAAAFFELAKLLFLSSNLQDAENYAVRATELDQENKWYFYFLAQLYRYQFNYKKEAETWEMLTIIEPLNLDYYFESALAYLEHKNYKKALKVLNNYEKKVAFSDHIFLLKSKIFEEQGDDKKQLKYLERGIEKFPKSILLLEEIAQYYIKTSEYILANTIYKKIVTIDPTNSTALLASYTILSNQKKIEEEKKVLTQIINSDKIDELKKQELILDILTKEDKLILYYEYIPNLIQGCILLYPETAFFYNILADFYALDQQYVLARDYYLKAIAFDSNSSILWERAIYMSLLEQDYKKTIIDSKLAIDLFPLQGNLYYYKGLAEFYEKRYKESIKTLNNAIIYVLDDAWLLSGIYETLGNNYHALAEQDPSSSYHIKSDENFEKALEYDPQNVYLLNNYSYYLSIRGEKLNLAKDMIEKCISINTDPNPSFLDTYAWVLFKLNEYDNAVKMIRKSIQFGGDSAIIFEHYGDILKALGLLEEAIVEWERALIKDPLNQDLQKKILDTKND